MKKVGEFCGCPLMELEQVQFSVYPGQPVPQGIYLMHSQMKILKSMVNETGLERLLELKAHYKKHESKKGLK